MFIKTFYKDLAAEAALFGVFCKKKVLWKCCKNVQENTCARIFFNLVAGLNFIKKETLAQMFSYEFCEIFKNQFFYKTPLVVASVANLSQSHCPVIQRGI